MHVAARFKLQTTDGALLKAPSQTVCKAKFASAGASAAPPIPVLPKLSACRHFLNLTNGIEAVPLLESLDLSYR